MINSQNYIFRKDLKIAYPIIVMDYPMDIISGPLCKK